MVVLQYRYNCTPYCSTYRYSIIFHRKTRATGRSGNARLVVTEWHIRAGRGRKPCPFHVWLVHNWKCRHHYHFADTCKHLLTFADICWHLLTVADICWQLLTFADSCWHLLTVADEKEFFKYKILRVCWHLLTFADSNCWRLLTFADICWHLLTFADICWSLPARTMQQFSENALITPAGNWLARTSLGYRISVPKRAWAGPSRNWAQYTLQ